MKSGTTVTIVDCGMGNLQSVANAFEAVGALACIARTPEELSAAERIVLPGVGAFGHGMTKLREGGWVRKLEDEVRGKGKPFLGICLGMQLLASVGTEHGQHEGLNWITGEVRRMVCVEPSLRLPHIGWNDVRFVHSDGLYEGLGESQVFYFVHSYALNPDDGSVVSGVCNYGTEFAASIQKDNLYATQFHPEKSHRAGLAVLKNFARLGG